MIDLFRSKAEESIDAHALKQVGTIPPVSLTSLDIINLLLPHLSSHALPPALEMCLEMLHSSNALFQKKGYKGFIALGRSESGKAQIISQCNLTSLVSSTAAVQAPICNKERLILLDVLVALLPQSELHVLPALLPEVILGMKAENTKTRTLCFELIIKIADKMNLGGTVRRSQIKGMKSGAADVPATLDEFFSMVAAGLASKTTIMMTATIAALSRLMFEYRRESTVSYDNPNLF